MGVVHERTERPRAGEQNAGEAAELLRLMRLLSINVGLPRPIAVDGEIVETGIFKYPVEGGVTVRLLNLDGDRQADLTVHGGPDKAVYAYDWKNVLYWQKTLGRKDLGAGSLGENLTVEGLTEEDVAIGDELEIGTARLQVTQPRFPCFKLGAALQMPGFPKMFLDSGRLGFYLRVLQEGVIQAGERIRLLTSREAERVTIAELAQLHRDRTATPERIKKIYRLASLSAVQKEWLLKKFPEALK